MNTRRADLLRLTPDALAQLANVGLVKRAQRELAAGYVPELALADDGRLTGEFPDQVRTEFAPGAGLREARCSCGAALCRHRIAVVLHYAAQQGTGGEADGDGASAAASGPVPDFASLTIEAVRAQTAASLWPAIERELASGLRIEVERSSGADGRGVVHTARLPHATARFYAGADLAFARCDCAAQTRCAHIALGALALMRAGTLDDARVGIDLGAAPGAGAAAGFSPEPYRALLRRLLERGLARGSAADPATAAALTAALAASRALAATWLTLCLEAIEQWLDAYQRRSARFAYADGVALLTELAMRVAAAERGGGALSPRSVLGIGEAMESALDRLTLVSLGLRIEADGDLRRATLAVVDGDTQTLLSLGKQWQRDAGSKESELALLDRQRVATSLRLGRLATGSLVTTTAKRRANGELRLGQSFAGKASIGAQNGDWSRLSAPLLIDTRRDYFRRQRLAPPAMLDARTALPGFHVLRVRAVADLAYDPARQCLHAVLVDADDEPWSLQRHYAAATPGALDAIAGLLSRAVPDTQPLYVAGRVQRGAHGLVIDPWALSAGGVVVPDVAPPDGALAGVRLADAMMPGDDALSVFLGQLDECLCDLLRDGLTQRGNAITRIDDLVARSRTLGLDGGDDDGRCVSRRLASLRVALNALQAGEREPLDAAVADIVEIALWGGLARHAVASMDNGEDNDAAL
jgi:hypothetical protein